MTAPAAFVIGFLCAIAIFLVAHIALGIYFAFEKKKERKKSYARTSSSKGWHP
jgi:hypothetical protein